ncbi:MAG: hypothetical protein Q9218_006903, partial [Villophora microphyllina]
MAGGKVPDAWDDDWIQKADVRASGEPFRIYIDSMFVQSPASEAASAPKAAKLSKAERRAKQLEFNRQLWEDAETQNQNQNFFLNSRTEVPLKSEFKPTMKVLSRKPTTGSATPADAASGLGQLSLDDDEDEEDEAKTRTLTAEERQLKAQKDREEKQRKYEEARHRLFGANSASSGKSSGTTTLPKQRTNGESRGPNRNRPTRDSRPTSASGTGTSARQLYDPSCTAKPDSLYVQRKEETPTASGRSTPNEQHPIPLTAAGPIPEAEAEPQLPPLPSVPGLPTGLAASVTSAVLSLIPSATSAGGGLTSINPGLSGGQLGLNVPNLPAVPGGLPVPVPVSVPGVSPPSTSNLPASVPAPGALPN